MVCLEEEEEEEEEERKRRRKQGKSESEEKGFLLRWIFREREKEEKRIRSASQPTSLHCQLSSRSRVPRFPTGSVLSPRGRSKHRATSDPPLQRVHTVLPDPRLQSGEDWGPLAVDLRVMHCKKLDIKI
ncbi:hypothetical protein AAC387_Pa12g2087 [Persea americana]